MPQLMRTSPCAPCSCSNYLYLWVVVERLLRRLTLFATNAALPIIKNLEGHTYTVLTPKEFGSRRARKDAFLENVWHNKRVSLISPNEEVKAVRP